MKNVLCALSIITVIATGCSNSQAHTDDPKKTADSASASTDTKATPAENAGTKWKYSDEEDKMTSQKTFFATLVANEQLNLKMPYDGGVTVSLMIRSKNKSNDVILNLSKGQFMTGINGQDIRVRFDSAKVETIHCSGANDGSTENLFIMPANKFLAKLKKAKKVLIEAELFDNGSQQMEFNTDGFKWEY